MFSYYFSAAAIMLIVAFIVFFFALIFPEGTAKRLNVVCLLLAILAFMSVVSWLQEKVSIISFACFILSIGFMFLSVKLGKRAVKKRFGEEWKVYVSDVSNVKGGGRIVYCDMSNNRGEVVGHITISGKDYCPAIRTIHNVKVVGFSLLLGCYELKIK